MNTDSAKQGLAQNAAFQLAGKTVIVTGGGRGIGAGIARVLGGIGCQVALTYTGSNPKGQAGAEALAAEIENSGGKAKAYPLQVEVEAQCQDLVAKVVADFGSLYGLVNNAGVVIDQLALRYKMEDFDHLMAVNLRGAFQMSKAALKIMMKNSDGASIVNMSSVVGLSGNAGQVPYSTTKAGLIGMTKSLALEMASRQVRVNAIAPGFIETDMVSDLNASQKEAITSRIPLRSLGNTDDIAWASVYLLSPLSRYVTGQVLSVNGGLYL